MLRQAPQQYAITQIQTASPGELTLMLYNGSIRFLKKACQCIDADDIKGKHTFLQKAYNIIEELQITLNMDYSLSNNLHQLYSFVMMQINQSNLKMDKKPIEDCIELLVELRDTWAEAVKQLKPGVEA